jgi:hypothetical protein
MGRKPRPEMFRRHALQSGSVRNTVTCREEVRPMNAVTKWVLPLVVAVER